MVCPNMAVVWKNILIVSRPAYGPLYMISSDTLIAVLIVDEWKVWVQGYDIVDIYTYIIVYTC